MGMPRVGMPGMGAVPVCMTVSMSVSVIRVVGRQSDIQFLK